MYLVVPARKQRRLSSQNDLYMSMFQ